MTFQEYQQEALKTAIYPGKKTIMGLAYTSLGLGEAGELQGKVKKIIRDNAGEMSQQQAYEMSKELGDLLWYVAATAEELGYTLDEVAEGNIAKLRSRQERGVLQGSGDNR